MNMPDVIEKRKNFFGVSFALVVLSWVAVFSLGLNPGIDLIGGTQWQVELKEENPSAAEVQVFLNSVIPSGGVSAKQAEDGSFIIRLSDINEEYHQQYLLHLTKEFGEVEEKIFSSVGPTIGSELKNKSIWAIVLVLAGISIYIAWAFRKVSRPIQSWKYGVVSLITLVHDVSIPTGLLAVLGVAYGVEIDTNFIVALLVVMGFSVHDTIVVFDRIRENLILMRGKTFSLGDIINHSVRETIARSINTSLTLILVLVAIMAFGPPSLFYFVLVILVGTVFGTYSSIFVASPLLFVWEKINSKTGNKSETKT